MRKVKDIYKKRPFIYSLIMVLFLLIPLLFVVRERAANISQRIAQTAACDARTIACDPQFQENKGAACGAFKSLAVDNLLSRDDSPCKGMDRSFVEGELDKACTQGCVAATSAPTVTVPPTTTTVPSATSFPTDPPQASATVAPSPTITTAPSAGPSATLVPSATSMPGEAMITFSLKYPGIGNGLSENTNPKTLTRQILISLQNTSGQNIKPYTAEAAYENGLYNGTFNVKEAGNYLFTLKMDNTRVATSAGIHLVPESTAVIPQLTLTPGDLDQNNVLDIYDFNILIKCYGEKACSQKQQSDLNDDGVVDSKDLNILLRSFALRNN